MPDQKGDTGVDEETIPDTSLHAYNKDGREKDVKGDVDTGTTSESENDEQGGATPKY